MNPAQQIPAVILSYLLGAVPFGLLFGKLFSNIDVRGRGSGNIGATNVLRVAGKKAAVLTLLCDMLKGLLPVLVVKTLFHDDVTTVLAGAAAFAGHIYPVFLGFKGGKGVATGFGVVLAVSLWIGLICLLTWIVAAFIWRYSSLAALIAFALYPVLTFFTPSAHARPQGVLALFIFGMIYYRHRENIRRILDGKESKIGATCNE